MSFAWDSDKLREEMAAEWKAKRDAWLRRQAEGMTNLLATDEQIEGVARYQAFDPGPIVVDTKRRRDWYWLLAGTLLFAASAFAAVWFL